MTVREMFFVSSSNVTEDDIPHIFQKKLLFLYRTSIINSARCQRSDKERISSLVIEELLYHQ